ncbi:MAG: hypothetical protein B7733_05905 [Myxococcales bacterium FL481]|nr:MAG: hypothetical protein B7733_05905 [Myxococcales bacterium FL481]
MSHFLDVLADHVTHTNLSAARNSGRAVVRFREVEGAWSTYTIDRAAVFPMDEYSRRQLPEGVRHRATLRMGTDSDVRPGQLAMTGDAHSPGDVVEIDGRVYWAYRDADWVGLGFGWLVLVLVDQPYDSIADFIAGRGP